MFTLVLAVLHCSKPSGTMGYQPKYTRRKGSIRRCAAMSVCVAIVTEMDLDLRIDLTCFIKHSDQLK